MDRSGGTPGALDDDAMVVSQTLADVAAAFLLAARAHSGLEAASLPARAMSLRDPPTALPARFLLLAVLDHAIMRRGRSGKVVAVSSLTSTGAKRSVTGIAPGR